MTHSPNSSIFVLHIDILKLNLLLLLANNTKQLPKLSNLIVEQITHIATLVYDLIRPGLY